MSEVGYNGILWIFNNMVKNTIEWYMISRNKKEGIRSASLHGTNQFIQGFSFEKLLFIKWTRVTGPVSEVLSRYEQFSEANWIHFYNKMFSSSVQNL